MNPYDHYVQTLSNLLAGARALPLGGFPNYPVEPIAKDAPVALIFSPHPDDEVIIGGLALRLMREAGWNPVNVAVTQGSNRERQAARWQELEECCRCIGFDLVPTAPRGLEKINPRTRDQETWDPLFYGYEDWSTWYVGEIIGNFVALNRDLIMQTARLRVQPSDAVTVQLIYNLYRLNEPVSEIAARDLNPRAANIVPIEQVGAKPPATNGTTVVAIVPEGPMELGGAD